MECEPRIVWLQGELARLAPRRVLDHGVPDVLIAARAILSWGDKMRLRYWAHRSKTAVVIRFETEILENSSEAASEDWRVQALRERYRALPTGKQRLLRVWFRDTVKPAELRDLVDRGMVWCPGNSMSHYVGIVLD